MGAPVFDELVQLSNFGFRKFHGEVSSYRARETLSLDTFCTRELLSRTEGCVIKFSYMKVAFIQFRSAKKVAAVLGLALL